MKQHVATSQYPFFKLNVYINWAFLASQSDRTHGAWVAIQVLHLIHFPKDVQQLDACVQLWDHHDGSGPRAEGFLNDPVPQHLAPFHFLGVVCVPVCVSVFIMF